MSTLSSGNPVRGEQRVTIGGVEYVFRPEHDALAAIEGALDTGLLDLAQRFVKGKSRITDIARILRECSRVAGQELPYPQAWDFALARPREATHLAAQLLVERFGPPPESSPGKETAAGS